jgi:predicted Zn-dependent protease
MDASAQEQTRYSVQRRHALIGIKHDLDGWQRLLRAYMVLGERDKAHAAAADAKRALANDPDKLRRIEDMIKSLGLEG